MRIVKEAFKFQWDKGNSEKNKKHNVEDKESEEVFFDQNRHIFRDHIHSNGEERFRILGKTNEERLLFVVFTKRNKKIRIISARDTNKKERRLYEEKIKASKVQK